MVQEALFVVHVQLVNVSGASFGGLVDADLGFGFGFVDILDALPNALVALHNPYLPVFLALLHPFTGRSIGRKPVALVHSHPEGQFGWIDVGGTIDLGWAATGRRATCRNCDTSASRRGYPLGDLRRDYTGSRSPAVILIEYPLRVIVKLAHVGNAAVKAALK